MINLVLYDAHAGITVSFVHPVDLSPHPVRAAPGDAASIAGAGFTDVTPLEGAGEWLGLALARTPAARAMASVASGAVKSRTPSNGSPSPWAWSSSAGALS